MNGYQAKILEIYKVISTICDELGLRHFAIGGTAIGAVRHKGFIPWDDDLDIAMPIEDYEEFLRSAASLLPENMVLVQPGDSSSYGLIFSKVVDQSTTGIQWDMADTPDRYTGVWVDIMPMSGVPDPGTRRDIFVAKLRLLLFLNKATRFVPRGGKTKAKVFHQLLRPLWPLGKRGVFGSAYYRELQKHPFDGSSYCGYTWSKQLKRLVFPRAWFQGTAEMQFEDCSMRVPAGWDAYLTQQFGDYMVVPPTTGQQTHKLFVDLEHSYKDYASGKIPLPEDAFE